MVFDTQNQLWIGTYKGVIVAKNDRSITVLQNDIGDDKSLSNNSVKSLFKDAKGSIWIGTYYGGVNIWDESNVDCLNITQKPYQKGLSYNVVSSIENFKDDIFFGTEGMALLFLINRIMILNISTGTIMRHYQITILNLCLFLMTKNFG